MYNIIFTIIHNIDEPSIIKPRSGILSSNTVTVIVVIVSSAFLTLVVATLIIISGIAIKKKYQRTKERNVTDHFYESLPPSIPLSAIPPKPDLGDHNVAATAITVIESEGRDYNYDDIDSCKKAYEQQKIKDFETEDSKYVDVDYYHESCLERNTRYSQGEDSKYVDVDCCQKVQEISNNQQNLKDSDGEDNKYVDVDYCQKASKEDKIKHSESKEFQYEEVQKVKEEQVRDSECENCNYIDVDSCQKDCEKLA